MKNIYNYTLDELADFFEETGLKRYRGTQLFEWLYRHKVCSFDEISNIKKEVIQLLKTNFELTEFIIEKHQKSNDGTEKFLFRLADGLLIESVLMKHPYGYSVCVSSQAGCNMGCAFCASGLVAKTRNLHTHEMVNQVMMISRVTKERIGHVVVMGSGEPFDNYDNVLRFIRIINDSHGFEIGARHISVSTCGIIPRIYDYQKEKLQSNLAISLHASDDETRSKLMRINNTYPLLDLVKSIDDYIAKTNRRVTIEYILIDGVNDSIADAYNLAKLLAGLNVYINLIPYNEVNEVPYKRSTEQATRAFYDVLKKCRFDVTARREHGGDIDAACGQLRNRYSGSKHAISDDKKG